MTEYSADFEMFWKIYPDRWDRNMNQRIKRKKAPAFEKWKKLSKEIRAECLLKAKDIKYAEGSSARDCVTWINQRGWEDMRKEEGKKPLPSEIQAMVDKLLKTPDYRTVNFHDERNRQLDLLEGKAKT